jgi:hypothetical protein
MGEANYQSFLTKKEEGEEYDHMMRYLGGKRRTKGGNPRKHKETHENIRKPTKT